MDTKTSETKRDNKAEQEPSCCGGDHAGHREGTTKPAKPVAPKAEDTPRTKGSCCCS